MPSGRGYSRGGSRGCRGGRGAAASWGPQLEDNEHLQDEDDFDPDDIEAEGDDSSDEDAANDELVQAVALPVSGGPLPPSDEPPKDADEYLRRVQWERMHLSDTVDVEVNEKPARKRKQQTNNRASLLTRFDAPDVPDELAHCSEWAEDAVSAFRDLRAKCDEMRQATVEAGEEVAADSFNAEEWREQILSSRPTTSLLAMQDVVSIHRILVIVIDAVVEAQDAAAAPAVSGAPGGASASETAPQEVSGSSDGPFGPGSFLADWAFAVLTFIEEPTVDDMQYNLQRLRRTCQKGIVAAHAKSETGSSVFDSNAHAQATLLLTVVREHFGQR